MYRAVRYGSGVALRCPNVPTLGTRVPAWTSLSSTSSRNEQISYARAHSTSASPIGDGSSSVNASEVGHFTQLAASWWDPHGPSRLLHLMNPLRHDFIQSCLRSASPASSKSNGLPTSGATRNYKYLDVGCGGGIFASSAARLPNTASVTAIDPTSEVIKVAREHQRGDPMLSQHGRLQYLNCAIEELGSHVEGQGKEGFDFVTVFEVVEHIDKPAAFLRQALAHLKPGGWLIGSTIARHPMSYLTTKIVAEAPWPIGVVPPGTHDWNKYVNPSEVREWFAHENHELHTRNVETSDNEGRIEAGDKYGGVRIEGCIYLPLLGWKWAGGTAEYGNFFFGVQKLH